MLFKPIRHLQIIRGRQDRNVRSQSNRLADRLFADLDDSRHLEIGLLVQKVFGRKPDHRAGNEVLIPSLNCCAQRQSVS